MSETAPAYNSATTDGVRDRVAKLEDTASYFVAFQHAQNNLILRLETTIIELKQALLEQSARLAALEQQLSTHLLLQHEIDDAEGELGIRYGGRQS